MEGLYLGCAGLDVHAGSVTACVRIAVDAAVTDERHRASANARGLLDLGQWPTAHGCTHVATGATGTYWAILTALVAGDTDPERLADPTRGRLKATRADLVDALPGRVTSHHRFMIQGRISRSGSQHFADRDKDQITKRLRGLDVVVEVKAA